MAPERLPSPTHLDAPNLEPHEGEIGAIPQREGQTQDEHQKEKAEVLGRHIFSEVIKASPLGRVTAWRQGPLFILECQNSEDYGRAYSKMAAFANPQLKRKAERS